MILRNIAGKFMDAIIEGTPSLATDKEMRKQISSPPTQLSIECVKTVVEGL